MSAHVDKRSLWQVAEMFGWEQTDLGRVRDFYCQPSVLKVFVPFYNVRLSEGLKLGFQHKKVASLALEALQGIDDRYMRDIDKIDHPHIGDYDVWFTVRLVEICRGTGGIWEGRGDEELEEMVTNAAQAMKVLNKQFERIQKRGTYGTDLPNQMVKEAYNLGLELDIGVDVVNAPGRGPRHRRRYPRRSNIQGNMGTIVASPAQPSEQSAFQEMYNNFKQFYGYDESLPFFRFSVIMLYYTLELEGEKVDKTSGGMDRYVLLRQNYMKELVDILESGGRHPGSYSNWLSKKNVYLDEGALTWEWVNGVVNTKEGQAFLVKARELVARGSVML
jgi:hypothetical protein